MRESHQSTLRRIAIVGLLFSPDLLIAYLYTVLDEKTSFLVALAVLLGVQLVFWFLKWIGEALAWYLVGRRAAIENFLKHFRELNYPIRTEKIGFTLYLHRLPEGCYKFEFDSEEEDWKKTRLLEDAYLLRYNYDKHYKDRMRSAIDAAFEIHSPISLATAPL